MLADVVYQYYVKRTWLSLLTSTVQVMQKTPQQQIPQIEHKTSGAIGQPNRYGAY